MYRWTKPHRTAALLAACLLAPPALGQAAQPAFTPIDADAVITGCWSLSAGDRASPDPALRRRGMIATVKCLREEFLLHYRAVIDVYVNFAEGEDNGLANFIRDSIEKHGDIFKTRGVLDAVDPEIVRKRHQGDYETRARQGSCFPSCSPIDESNDLDGDAWTGALLLRDLIAERALYALSVREPARFAFVRVRDADRLIRDCWAISERMRSGPPKIAAWGFERSIRCLEYAVIGQAESIPQRVGQLRRRSTRSYLHWLARLGDQLLAPMHRASPTCAKGGCGAEIETGHLRDHADLVEHALRTVVGIRIRQELESAELQ